jgi:uncharacterized protein
MEIKYDTNSDNRLISSDRRNLLLNDQTETVIHLPRLVKYLRSYFRLDWDGIHGAGHWGRVHLNGSRIAKMEGARQDVVILFAFLHDHERLDDNEDPGHGARAALHAHELRNEFFTIDDGGFRLLLEAMSGHSTGDTKGDITIRTCWDADRLDLGRVGVKPDPKYLCTDTAKDSEFLHEAWKRSIS